jgi:diguanylate cyclase (GGDEF)-like protein/PAS domain S-box-containing protein
VDSSTSPIRILHLEDDVADSELIQRELTRSGFSIDLKRVESQAEFLRQLQDFNPQMVLSDNSLPDIDSRGALEALLKRRPHTPFIVVSGTIGEERAVEILKQGAADYVLKDRLAKLAPAVSRALDRSRERAARESAEMALRESAQRFRELADAMPQIVWTARCDGAVEYCNRRWYEFTGFAPESSGALGWGAILHPQDGTVFATRVQAALDSREPYELECRFKDRRSGGYRWHLLRAVPVFNASGGVDRWFGTATDIDDRKRAEQELLRNAYYDPLTQLANRALFENRLEKAARGSSRDKNLVYAVLFLDIDRFKLVNDSLGHGAGDRLLQEFARRLESLVRPGDTVARFGGDEFAVLVEYITDLDLLKRIAERILNGLSLPFKIEGHEIVATASIGVAHSGPESTTPEAMVRNADLAMYRAKNLGRSRIEVFDEAMHAQSMATLRLEQDLRKALERSELVLHYQPIVCLRTNRITGCEALVRWKHPERGLVPPGDFIPLAEETGLIVPIGEWVLRTACAQLADWSAKGLTPLDLAVNLSAREFRHEGLAAALAATLADSKVDPRHVTLELTESLLMEHTERTISILRDLNERGLQLSIDDFGTGYSSLAYLKRLPCASLKIDRSFVRDIHNDPDDAAIAIAIIRMAHALRLKVIAEGVETPEQRAYLKERRCDEAQGYLFSRPLPPEAFFDLVTKQTV